MRGVIERFGALEGKVTDAVAKGQASRPRYFQSSREELEPYQMLSASSITMPIHKLAPLTLPVAAVAKTNPYSVVRRSIHPRD
jgi:hypothetical protein